MGLYPSFGELPRDSEYSLCRTDGFAKCFQTADLFHWHEHTMYCGSSETTDLHSFIASFSMLKDKNIIFIL